MRVLLDTHALVWWLVGDARVSRKVRRILDDEANEVFVSPASVWEITTKYRLGKMPDAAEIARDVRAHADAQEFRELPITSFHAQRAGSFAVAHRDPFDRMLAAQSLLENLPIASRDDALDAFGVDRIW